MRCPARPAPGGAPGRARAARRGAGRAPREGEAARLAPPFRRRDEPAGDPQAVRGPHGDRGDADIRARPRRGRLPADQGRRPADPAAADDDEPRELDRLGVRARPLPRRAGRSGRDDDPAGDSRPEAPRRARPGRRRAHGRQGPWQGRRAAAELRARGRRHGAADRPRRGDGGPPDDCGDRRVRARGPEPADLGARRERGVACSRSRSGRSSTRWGGRSASVRGTASSAARSSIRWAKDHVSVGFVVGLEYADVELSAHDLLQEFKTHRLLRKILDGGERVAWGAKTITEGGLNSLPVEAQRPGTPPRRRRRRARQRAAPERDPLRDRVGPARGGIRVRGAPARARSPGGVAPSTRTTPRCARATCGRTWTRCGTCGRRSTRASSWAAPSRAR